MKSWFKRPENSIWAIHLEITIRNLNIIISININTIHQLGGVYLDEDFIITVGRNTVIH